MPNEDDDAQRYIVNSLISTSQTYRTEIRVSILFASLELHQL